MKEFYSIMTNNRLVVSQTPLRISLLGGGSDIKEHYSVHGGSVVSFTIKQYIYVNIQTNNKIFGDKFRISYAKNEHVSQINDIENGIVRESLRLLDIDIPLYISTSADLPARSGLGSSSSFAVGLLNALHAFLNENVPPQQLAEEACEVEIQLLRKSMGKQDQYAAAFGGLNHFIFNRDGSVDVKNLGEVSEHPKLFDNLFLVWTALLRDAETVLSDQVSNSNKNFDSLISMSATADTLANLLESKNFQSEVIGKMLLDSWNLKKSLSEKISNTKIDKLMNQCLQSGCTGGKLLGAGGGGFLLVQASDPLEFTKNFESEFLVPVIPDQLGSRIILKI